MSSKSNSQQTETAIPRRMKQTGRLLPWAAELKCLGNLCAAMAPPGSCDAPQSRSFLARKVEGKPEKKMAATSCQPMQPFALQTFRLHFSRF